MAKVNFFETPWGKLTKAILRNVAIGILGIIVADLITLLPSVEGLNLELVAKVVAVLKIIDEALHKTGWAEKGLTRF